MDMEAWFRIGELASSGCLPALVAALAAIGSAYLTNRFAEARFEREHRDRLLGTMLDARLRAYEEVNAAMVDCYFTLNYHANVPVRTQDEFRKEIESKRDEYKAIKNKHSVWFDRELLDALNAVMGSFSQFTMAIWLNLPPEELPPSVRTESYSLQIREPDSVGLTRSFRRAQELLREKLGITALEEVLHEVYNETKREAEGEE